MNPGFRLLVYGGCLAFFFLPLFPPKGLINANSTLFLLLFVLILLGSLYFLSLKIYIFFFGPNFLVDVTLYMKLSDY